MRARSARYALIAFGWICVAVGVIGIVVPGLPTTVFLLMAAWAFSRSSERFQNWLLAHPRLGPPVIAWRERGAIPARAKILAVAMMSVSFT
ncbi:MAG: YbaN family protein [Alphaproteobacteria bacterium]